MKNLTKSLLLLTTISLSYACSEKSNNGSQIQFVESSSNTIISVSFEDETITDLVNDYLVLKNALVETNGEETQKAAKELLETIENSSNEALSNLEVQVQKVAETTDPESQRVTFDLISEQMVLLAKSSVLTEGKLYKQYCPMAKNNEGAFWLSASKEIQNPYFGDKMLNCGSIEEEI